MSIRDEFNRSGPIVDKLNAAIRDNPLAAGLIGAGVAWMLFGGGKGFGQAAGVVSTAAGKAVSAVTGAGGTLASGVAYAGTNVASSIREAASGTMSPSASIVPDASQPDPDTRPFEAVSQVGAAIGDGMNAAAAAGREYSSVIQSRLSETLQQQPLVLGAIGLVIGAGIASTFATTKLEGELMGEQSAATRDALHGFATDVNERATQVVSDVKSEAERQGLTTTAAKDAVKDVANKAKTVAEAGRDSLKGQFRD